MNRYDCEAIRDLLPSLIRGEMLPHEAARAEEHLDGCVDCSAEADIVRLLQATLAPVPPVLEERVLHAVRRRAARRRLPAGMALAATLAAAVLGGTFAFRTLQTPAPDYVAVTWAAAEDPLLHGVSKVHELSVEELEQLLEQMEP